MKSWGARFNYYRFLILFILFISLTGCFHNEEPISDAGESQSVLVGDKVLLDGSNSYDSDGNIVEYKWELLAIPAGSGAFLSDSATNNPTFVVDIVGAYVVGLIVFDGELYSNQDIVIVTATREEASTPHFPPSYYRQYVTLVDSAIIIEPIDHSEMRSHNFPSSHSKMLSTDQNSTEKRSYSEPISNWEILKKPADSNASLAFNEDREMEFVADAVGDYFLNLTHALTDSFSIFFNALVRVQGTPVVAIADKQVAVGNSVALIVSIIDEIDRNDIELQWDIVLKPDDSNAQVMLGEHSPILKLDVAGQYEVKLSVETAFDLYADTILIEAVGESSPDIDPTPTYPFGLSIEIEGVDTTYPIGDVIKLSATLTNNSDVDVEYYKMTSSSVGVVVEIQTTSGSRFTLRHPTDPDFDLQVVTKAILMPGESITRNVEWDQSIPREKMAVPGDYKVNAFAFITQLNEETSAEFSSTGIITIDSPADIIITEVNAILAGLKDAMVNQWYMKNQMSMLCSTESEGLVLVNGYAATPIQTLVAVPESEINCSAKLLASANQWKVSYRGTTPTDNARFEVIIDVTTGDIIPKAVLFEMK